ncbi:MAG: Mth938-like domain-containing protein [Sphingomonadaceae bacterium]
MAPRFDRDAPGEGPLVRGFAGRDFRIGEEIYHAALITPRGAQGWRPPPLERLAAADLEALLDLDPAPEFVLLGTGASFALPPAALRLALEERGVGLEAMDSRAAARAWGVLRGEMRWIAAALMPL